MYFKCIETNFKTKQLISLKKTTEETAAGMREEKTFVKYLKLHNPSPAIRLFLVVWVKMQRDMIGRGSGYWRVIQLKEFKVGRLQIIVVAKKYKTFIIFFNTSAPLPEVLKRAPKGAGP